jgi:DNA invertase Pin-like site-specific DNA recombinase
MDKNSKNSKILNSNSDKTSIEDVQIQISTENVQVQLLNNMNNMFSNMNSFMLSMKPWIDSLSTNVNNSSSTVNSKRKNSDSTEEIRNQNSNIELINLTEESNEVKTKRVKSSKEIVFVWTRISSNNQENNTSLQLQQQECDKYIKNNDLSSNQTMIFKNIGSGYSLSPSIKDSLNLVNEYIDKKKFKVTIVCYMVDRLLRNKEKALELIEKVHSSGGNVHFVKSNEDEFATLISDNELHKNCINKLLDIAQTESKIKSNRIKDFIANKNDNLMINMMNNPEVKNFQKFIQLFLDGGNIKHINNEFSKFVDWESHPDWNYLKISPITVEDNSIEHRGNNEFLVKAQTEVRRDARLKNLCSLFNSFKIEVPNSFKPRKRWSFDFIKLFTKDYISNLTTRINNL